MPKKLPEQRVLYGSYQPPLQRFGRLVTMNHAYCIAFKSSLAPVTIFTLTAYDVSVYGFHEPIIYVPEGNIAREPTDLEIELATCMTKLWLPCCFENK